MEVIKRSDRMEHVHSDIRGPLFVEAMQMRANGIDVLRLNTGNPATFGFKLPKSIEDALGQGVKRKLFDFFSEDELWQKYAR